MQTNQLFRTVLLAVLFAAYPAAAAGEPLELPAIGVWNGFLRHYNVVECVSAAPAAVALRLTLRSNAGAILGTRYIYLPAFGTRHIVLNDLGITDAYGTFSLEAAGGAAVDLQRLHCLSVFYRFAEAGSARPVDYAFALPLGQPLSGASGGTFNSFNPLGEPSPVFNWLSIYNAGTAPFAAAVRVFRQDGSADTGQSFYTGDLAPGERRDYPLGHPHGQVAGFYQVMPDDSSLPYGAFVSRYSRDSAGRFNFAFALSAGPGVNSGAVPASTMDPASNWAEIANPTDQEITVEAVVRDAAGLQKHRESFLLTPFSQRHLFLNRYIGEHSVGSVEARCLNSPAARLVLQSLYYGHRDALRQSVEWAYISPAGAEQSGEADAVIFPANTYLGAANWGKFLDRSSIFSELQLTLYDQEGGVRRRTLRALSGASALDVGIHEQSGPDFAGALLGRSAQYGAQYGSELLRVFPGSGGAIGSILAVPGRVLPAAASQRGALHVLPPQSRSLVYRGIPRLFVGDSVTQGWTELGTDFDQDYYLQVLTERGIGAVLLWSYMGIENQEADWRVGYHAPRLWPWVETSGRMIPPYAFSFVDSFGAPRFNEAYFSRLRQFAAAANERDIVVVITIHDGWTKGRFAGHPMNAANGGFIFTNSDYVALAGYGAEMPFFFAAGWSGQQKHQWVLERFVEKLVAATGDLPNVMYEVLNEGEWYDANLLNRFQRHFIQFLKARTQLPIVVNDPAMREEPLLDVVSDHLPNWTSGTSAGQAYLHFVDHFYSSPARPVLFTETVPEYQGGAANRYALMRLMWGTVLAGSGIFIQNDLGWRIERGEPDPMFDIEGHAARFLNALPYPVDEYGPCEELASSGVCLGRTGKHYIVYSQGESELSMDLSGLTGQVRIEFYNPATGQYAAALIVDGGQQQTITKPDASDWVAAFTAS